MTSIQKYLTLAGIIFCTIKTVSAQVTVWGSSGMSMPYNKTYSLFAKNFSDYTSPAVRKPMYGLGVGTLANFGILFGSNDEDKPIELGFYSSNIYSQNKVQYFRNEQRVFNYRKNAVGVQLGLRFEDDKLKGGLRFSAGLQFSKTVLESYFVYSDGTVSHGKERAWNGIYTNSSIFGNMGIVLNAEYFYTLFKKGKLTINAFSRLSYSGDIFKGHLIDKNTGNTFVDKWQTAAMLPTDPHYYATLGAPGAGGWVNNRFGAVCLQAGIAVTFSKAEKTKQ